MAAPFCYNEHVKREVTEMTDRMERLVKALFKKIEEDDLVIMSYNEFLELALYQFGETVYVEDAEGNVIDEGRAPTMAGLQEIADIYTTGFDVKSW